MFFVQVFWSQHSLKALLHNESTTLHHVTEIRKQQRTFKQITSSHKDRSYFNLHTFIYMTATKLQEKKIEDRNSPLFTTHWLNVRCPTLSKRRDTTRVGGRSCKNVRHSGAKQMHRTTAWRRAIGQGAANCFLKMLVIFFVKGLFLWKGPLKRKYCFKWFWTWRPFCLMFWSKIFESCFNWGMVLTKSASKFQTNVRPGALTLWHSAEASILLRCIIRLETAHIPGSPLRINLWMPYSWKSKSGVTLTGKKRKHQTLEPRLGHQSYPTAFQHPKLAADTVPSLFLGGFAPEDFGEATNATELASHRQLVRWSITSPMTGAVTCTCTASWFEQYST